MAGALFGGRSCTVGTRVVLFLVNKFTQRNAKQFFKKQKNRKQLDSNKFVETPRSVVTRGLREESFTRRKERREMDGGCGRRVPKGTEESEFNEEPGPGTSP